MTALLCGCGEVLFHEFRSIGSRGWEKAESLCFIYDGGSLAGECAGYLLSVEARTDASYSYKDLVVRIGGYSDYFTRLSHQMQQEVILRTEHEI